MEQNEQLYTEGFNNGYWIAKYEPILYSTLERGVQSKNDYVDGFVSGGREYEIEKNMPSKSRSIEKGKDRSRDMGKDI